MEGGEPRRLTKNTGDDACLVDVEYFGCLLLPPFVPAQAGIQAATAQSSRRKVSGSPACAETNGIEATNTDEDPCVVEIQLV